MCYPFYRKLAVNSFSSNSRWWLTPAEKWLDSDDSIQRFDPRLPNHYVSAVPAEFLKTKVTFARTVLERGGVGAVVALYRFAVAAEVGVLNRFAIEDHFDARAAQLYVIAVPFRGLVNLLAGRERAIKSSGELRVFSLGIVTKV